MAINDKEFYASHGFDFDYQNMLDKYIKGVKNQAKIEVLAEIQQEIEGQCKIPNNCASAYDWNNGVYACYKVIQQKINELKAESEDKK